MSKTCKTCSLWSPVRVVRYQTAYSEGGYCRSPLISEDDTDYPRNGLSYPYLEGARHFWTGPDFGCVNHKDRQ